MEYLLSVETSTNIILGIGNPVYLSPTEFRIQAHVNAFLNRHNALPITTVANTIFPASEYLHGGAQEVYEEFPKTFDQLRGGSWGTYAMRLLTKSLPVKNSTALQSPLQQLVAKMRRQRETTKMRSIYEVSLLEDEELLADIPTYRASSDSRYIRGGPCLSHLSFKLLPNVGVSLTAIYRYHYYVQRALGNLFGLAQLLAFVASEVGVPVGPLVCHSTYAAIDTEGGWTASEVGQLVVECKKLSVEQVA
jgi:hypothetical protein